jgi:hypothetical protein
VKYEIIKSTIKQHTLPPYLIDAALPHYRLGDFLFTRLDEDAQEYEKLENDAIQNHFGLSSSDIKSMRASFKNYPAAITQEDLIEVAEYVNQSIQTYLQEAFEADGVQGAEVEAEVETERPKRNFTQANQPAPAASQDFNNVPYATGSVDDEVEDEEEQSAKQEEPQPKTGRFQRRA